MQWHTQRSNGEWDESNRIDLVTFPFISKYVTGFVLCFAAFQFSFLRLQSFGSPYSIETTTKCSLKVDDRCAWLVEWMNDVTRTTCVEANQRPSSPFSPELWRRALHDYKIVRRLHPLAETAKRVLYPGTKFKSVKWDDEPSTDATGVVMSGRKILVGGWVDEEVKVSN